MFLVDASIVLNALLSAGWLTFIVYLDRYEREPIGRLLTLLSVTALLSFPERKLVFPLLRTFRKKLKSLDNAQGREQLRVFKLMEKFPAPVLDYAWEEPDGLSKRLCVIADGLGDLDPIKWDRYMLVLSFILFLGTLLIMGFGIMFIAMK